MERANPKSRTMLNKKICAYEQELGVVLEIIERGKTGGSCMDGMAWVHKSERNNLARSIRKIGRLTISKEAHVLPANHFVLFGAGVGGCKGCHAKQFEYAIVKMHYV